MGLKSEKDSTMTIMPNASLLDVGSAAGGRGQAGKGIKEAYPNEGQSPAPWVEGCNTLTHKSSPLFCFVHFYLDPC